MKKVLLLMGIMMLTGCTQAQTQTPANMLAESDARQIALQKAGLETATFTKQEYDSDDVDYEFEFLTDSMKYEREISALEGKIKDYSVEERYDR